jgi:predicted thioesterase
MTRQTPPKIELGLHGSCERIVTPELTLAHFNPNWPAVFSTPAMIGMMEYASSDATRLALPEGAVQVGVRIEVDHIKAVPIGVTVIAVSRLVEVNGRRLTFEAQASSGGDVIGRGRIFHAIVDHARFIANASENPEMR